MVILYGFGVRKQRWFAGVEKAFEQENSRDLVDGLRTCETRRLAGDFFCLRLIQQRVSIQRRQPLVDEMEAEVRMRGREKFAQSFRKGFRFFRLRAVRAVSMQRIADDHDFHLVLTDEPRDGLQVCALRCAAQGEERLRGDAESIGNGDADAAIANV